MCDGAAADKLMAMRATAECPKRGPLQVQRLRGGIANVPRSVSGLTFVIGFRTVLWQRGCCGSDRWSLNLLIPHADGPRPPPQPRVFTHTLQAQNFQGAEALSDYRRVTSVPKFDPGTRKSTSLLQLG